MAEVCLQRPGIDAFVGHRIAAGMTQHVRVNLEAHLRLLAGAGQELGEPDGVNGPPRSEAKTKGEARDYTFAKWMTCGNNPRFFCAPMPCVTIGRILATYILAGKVSLSQCRPCRRVSVPVRIEPEARILHAID